jgi:hypothetical protein
VIVQIQGVPEDVHRRLKSLAALADQTLDAFLLARLTEIAQTPTTPQSAERIRSRERYDGPSSAAVIRAARDAR